MMYHGSYRYEKAYQDEMRRVAGVYDEQELEHRRQSAYLEQGLLRRLLSGLFSRRKVAKPASKVSAREPHSTLIG